MGTVKEWIGGLTDIALMLIALAIVAGILVGSPLPFVGSVVSNLMAFIKDLGANGIYGLIALGIILWLFSGRTVS